MDIEAVKAKMKASWKLPQKERLVVRIREATIYLPDAIELIEKMVPLLERARCVTPFGQQWFDDVEAVLVEVGSLKKSP